MTQENPNLNTLLAIATSEKVSSVALVKDSQVLASLSFEEWLADFKNAQRVGKSTALVAMIKDLLAVANIRGETLSAIALTNGPGGFTGLRVGVVTARLLCYAWRIPAVVVNSLEVSAHKFVHSTEVAVEQRVWSVVDAQRKQVFTRQFRVGESKKLESVMEHTLLGRQEFIRRLENGDLVTGTGAFAIEKEIENKTGEKLPDRRLAQCDAVGVAKLAMERPLDQLCDDVFAIAPIYFRPSAAEEVRLAARNAAINSD